MIIPIPTPFPRQFLGCIDICMFKNKVRLSFAQILSRSTSAAKLKEK